MHSLSHQLSEETRTQFIIMAIILIAIGIVVIGCYLLYRKYTTRQMYNDSPQAFSKKPDLTANNMIKLFSQKLIPLNQKGTPKVIPKQLHEGKLYEVTFLDGVGGVYFSNLLTYNCYFEVQLLIENSILQIGYVHRDDMEKVKKGENINRIGVVLTNYGIVYSNGLRLYSYPLSFKYGDTLGMGITSFTGQRRAWVSHNGLLLNPPTSMQIDDWIDDASFDSEEKDAYKEENKEDADGEEGEDEKKKISLNTGKQFRYYAVVSSTQGKEKKNTVINMNVGGQAFRIHEKIFASGLLS